MKYTYADYDRAKADWLRANPDASQDEIEAAFRRIARKMRL